MRFKWFGEYWTGVALMLVLATLAAWLAIRGKLDLYVHPRYIWFTVVMCGAGLLAVLLGLAVKGTHQPPLFQRRGAAAAAIGAVCLLLCMVMVVLRPVGLTSSAASQRDANAAALSLNDSTASVADLAAPDAAYQRFTAKEWAALLAQNADPGLFEGKKANLTGFVSPGAANNPSVFQLSRFIISCCAVDARPISVPVYQPNWKAAYPENQWLEVSGSFIANPDSGPPVVLRIEQAKKVPEPAEPYVY